MNQFAENQNRVRVQERVIEIELLKKLYEELFGHAALTEAQLSNFNQHLKTLGLDANATPDMYINNDKAFRDLVVSLGEHPVTTKKTLAQLIELDKLRTIINRMDVDSSEDVENYLKLSGIDINNLPSDDVIQQKVDARENLLFEAQTDYVGLDQRLLDRLDNLPTRQLKDLQDLINLERISVNDIENLTVNPADLEEKCLFIQDFRKRLGLSRDSSSDEVKNTNALIQEASQYLVANDETFPFDKLNIKLVKKILKEKGEYENLANELGLTANALKAEVHKELEKLGIDDYIIGLHSGKAGNQLPSNETIQEAIDRKNRAIEEFRRKIATDPAIPPNLRQDILDLPPTELERRIRLVDEARKLQITDENALMDVDNQALAQRYRELGIGRFSSRFRTTEDLPIKENLAKREELIQAIRSKVPGFDPTGKSIKELEQKVTQITYAAKIENTAMEVNDLSNLTNADIRRGRKNLGFGALGGRLPKYGKMANYEIEPQLLAIRAKDLDPAEMWAAQTKKAKEAKTKVEAVQAKLTAKMSSPMVARLQHLMSQKNTLERDLRDAVAAGNAREENAIKTRLANLTHLIDQANQHEDILEIAKLQQEKAQMDTNKTEADRELDVAKTMAEPYKQEIEKNPNIKNAMTVKRMYAEGLQPDDNLAYWRIQRNVKKDLKKQEKEARKVTRKEYRIGPLTRGLFARRRIGRLNKMLEKAGNLGYKDPTQLFKAGFLNIKVLKRIEHKQKLIDEAKRYGLSPSTTTAHELNVERRIHQLRLHKLNRLPVVGPAVVSGFRRFWRVGNRTLGTNQTIDKIDPLKGGVQRFVPRRLAKGIGAPLRAVQKIINPKSVSEGAKVGKGIFKGILEVKTQLEKGIPEKKDGK